MPHLSKFRVGHYRGLDGLELDTIAPVNLITGPNGIGKTSLLEALWLFHRRKNPVNLWMPDIQRSHESLPDPTERLGGGELSLSGAEDGSEHTWRVAFEPAPVVSAGMSLTNGDPDSSEVIVRHAGILEVSHDGQPEPSPQVFGMRHWMVRIPNSDRNADTFRLIGPCDSLGLREKTVEDFGQLVIDGGKHDLVQDLAVVRPQIANVETIKLANRAYILATLAEGSRLPVEALGGGMLRLFGLLVGMQSVRNGVLCLDEVESGLHFEALPDFWKLLRRLSEDLHVQVFAATHSLECLGAACDVFEDSEEELAVHSLRLAQDGSGVRAASFRGESLEGARSLNLEIR